MQVLVDTSVWLLALRRVPSLDKSQAANLAQIAAVKMLRDLISDGRGSMLGAIRQELLSGIKSSQQFNTLRTALQGFEDISLTQADYERAAEFFNTCRSKGVQGSSTDFLICAAASTRNMPILSTDLDFSMYAKFLPIELLGVQHK